MKTLSKEDFVKFYNKHMINKKYRDRLKERNSEIESYCKERNQLQKCKKMKKEGCL